MALKIDILPLDNLAALEAEWRKVEAGADNRFFQSWAWVRARLSIADAKIILLRAKDGEQTVGLAFCSLVKDKRLGFLTQTVLQFNDTGIPELDAVTVEYNDVLALRGYEDVVRRAMLDALIQSSSISWSSLTVRSCQPAMAEAIEALTARHKLLVRSTAESPAAAADLDVARKKNTFLSGLSSNTRQQINRSIRIYEERGPLQLDRAVDVKTALDFMRSMGELHKARWGARNVVSVFNYPRYVRTHEVLISDQLPQQGVEVIRIRAGDFIIGYLYNFLYRGRVYFYLSGLDFEEDNRLKPGLVAHALCAQDHLERGAHVYDFMAGENRYKTSLGKPTIIMKSLIASRRTLVTRGEWLARQLKDRLQSS
jgi:CelD/BcsL family acetyltransferase involved in cellulose biosynthesis